MIHSMIFLGQGYEDLMIIEPTVAIEELEEKVILNILCCSWLLRNEYVEKFNCRKFLICHI